MDRKHFQASRVGVLAPGTNGCGISKTSTLLYPSLPDYAFVFFSLPSPSRRALRLGLCPGMSAGRHPPVQPQIVSHAPVRADLKTASMTDMFPIESSRDTT